MDKPYKKILFGFFKYKAKFWVQSKDTFKMELLLLEELPT